jgi:hypothetical protein
LLRVLSAPVRKALRVQSDPPRDRWRLGQKGRSSTWHGSPPTPRSYVGVRFAWSVRCAHTDTCGEITPELLTDLDVAALRWAGIDPFDHSTWVVHRGDCPG